jgi:hypothetical protein
MEPINGWQLGNTLSDHLGPSGETGGEEEDSIPSIKRKTPGGLDRLPVSLTPLCCSSQKPLLLLVLPIFNSVEQD